MNTKKILGFALGPLGASALGFISMPLVTWFYSVEDVGRISMLQVFASFSILLFSFGLDQAYVREYHGEKNKPKLLKACLTPGLTIISVTYILLYIINPNIVSQILYDIDSPYLASISILCFILTFISRFLSLIVRMEERAVAYSMSQILPKTLFLGFVISSVILGFQKNIYNLVTAHTLSITAVFVVFAWNTRKQWKESLKCIVERDRLKKLLAFGLPLVIGGLASWGLRVMDKLLLRSLSSFSELGLYSIAVSIAGVATIFATIFNTIWAPVVYKWVEEGTGLNKIDDISEHLLAAIYFLAVLSSLFSWVLPYFLPPAYANIQNLITLCILGPLFYTLSETTAIGIAISRKTRLSMLASIVAMLINAIGNYILIPKIGALGAAISTSFSFWIFFIFRTELSKVVWRKTPSLRVYTISLVLLITTVLNSTYLSNNYNYIILSLIMLVIGFIIFKSSFVSLIVKIKNMSKAF